jgi:D-sedoheptulose 7-phosphate isomerase
MTEALQRQAPQPAAMPASSLLFERNLQEHRQLFDELSALREAVDASAATLTACLRGGGKILLCGNGGSAADCQHIAAELTGRFHTERTPLAALALTTDSSALTCIGNDYGYEEVFARQLRALGRPGDCLVAISTSGRSENVLRAVEVATELDLKTIALTGGDGGPLALGCEHALVMPSSVTARIQEAHIFIGHTWCGLIEEGLGVC